MTKVFARNGRKTMEFSKIIQNGQNLNGFTAQTANGTAKSGNHPGWNREYKYKTPPAEATGVWANGNRSGE